MSFESDRMFCRFRFSLRFALLVTTIACGWLAIYRANQAMQWHHNALILSRFDTYNCFDARTGNFADIDVRPSWIEHLVGYDPNYKIVAVLPIEGCKVTEHTVTAINVFDNIEYLDLSGTNITDLQFSRIRPLDKLRSLDISGTALTSNSMLRISRFRSLVELRVDVGNVNDETILHMTKSRSLKRVFIAGKCLSLEIADKLLEYGIEAVCE